MALNRGAPAAVLRIGMVGACSVAGLAANSESAHAATSYLGSAVDYSFGIVQVEISVDGAGKIISITTPQVSQSRNNQSYSSYALPILVQEALKAQSSKISAVSGASYLSRGWITSLAAAIAKIPASTGVVEATPTTAKPTPTPTPTTAKPTPLPSRVTPPEHENENENENEGGERLPVAPVITPKATPKPTATPAPVATQSLGLVPHSSVIQKTIICIKGTLKKTVKSTAPKCPAGYTLKK